MLLYDNAVPHVVQQQATQESTRKVTVDSQQAGGSCSNVQCSQFPLFHRRSSSGTTQRTGVLEG